MVCLVLYLPLYELCELGEYLNLLMPQFLHLLNGNNTSIITVLEAQELSEPL